MREKLSVLEFRKYKERLTSLIKKFEDFYESESKEISEDEFKIMVFSEYASIQMEILQYDLSEIDFDEWEDVVFLLDEELCPVVDFSETHANIDFRNLSFDGEGRTIFKSCNLRNIDFAKLKLEDLDEEFIRSNSSLFLSDIFSQEFKNKYYDLSVTVDDLVLLSDAEINELESKNYMAHLDRSLSFNYLLKTYKLKDIWSLCRSSIEEFYTIEKLINDVSFFLDFSGDYSREKLLELIDGVDIKDLKEVIFNFYREGIINTKRYITVSSLPQSFIIENKDLFLVDSNISSDVKNKYFRRDISTVELSSNPELLSLPFPIDSFLSYNSTFNKMSEAYGVGKIQILFKRYPEFFKYLKESGKEYEFSDYVTESRDFESQFMHDVFKYISLHSEQFKGEDGEFAMPSWGTDMGFKSIKSIETVEDLEALDTHTIVLNREQYRMIDTFGLENLIRINRETQIFSNKEFNYSDLTIFNRLSNYVNNSNLHMINNSYEEVLNEFTIYIIDMLNNYVIGQSNDYYFLDDEFRREHSDIILDENAPHELVKAYYSRSITPKLLLEHPEYFDFLEGKSMRYSMVPFSVGTISHKDNFYKLFEAKFGSSEMLSFLKEYGGVLDSVLIGKYFDFTPEDTIDTLKEKINDSFRNGMLTGDSAFPTFIPDALKIKFPSMFLSDDAPDELKKVFYSRTITPNDILHNIDYLRGIDLELLYRRMNISLTKGDNFFPANVDLVKLVKDTFSDDSFDVMLIYGKYLDEIYKINKHRDFEIDENFNKQTLLDKIDEIVYTGITEDGIMYDESISSRFKKSYPTLFLREEMDSSFKEKFYGKGFTIDDFNDPNMLELFGNTNIACGFSSDVSWIIPLFGEKEDQMEANKLRLKLINVYFKIDDVGLRKIYKDYVSNNISQVDEDKIDLIYEVLLRLSLSNSSEMYRYRESLTTQILNSEDPLVSLDKIEEVFIKNNIPTVGKVYSCFQILHPDFAGFNFNDSSIVSPVLKKSSTMGRRVTVFSDLIYSSFGSNNRGINSYINNIEFGSNLFDRLKVGEVNYQELSDLEKSELKTFVSHLATLYNNTLKGKNNSIILTGDDLADLFTLSSLLSPTGDMDYNLGDRVIRMFCGFSGINNVSDAKRYIYTKVHNAEERNKEASKEKMTLHKGDFVKGVGDIVYLRNILQNGSVSKEYLGSAADSDNTPLDTDVSMILTDDGDNETKISKTAAKGYGHIWFVLRGDDRFITTRDLEGEKEVARDLSKLEVFHTGVLGDDHYGIRTGFASSEIDYIICDPYDDRVGLEVASNGFYIPIVNKNGEVLFTFDDYEEIRGKMSGLSYYGTDEYSFSPNLVTDDTTYYAGEIEANNFEVFIKRQKINKVMRDALSDCGLKLKTVIDGDLSEGYVELIDTGSTGRGTNKPGDGDFDFMVRLDKRILSDKERLEELKEVILKRLGGRESFDELVVTGDGDFRIKGVKLDSETVVDIDLTFCQKVDNLNYSTDMCLQDRLSNIKKQDPEKYKYVISNILLAKRVLKDIGAYKPDRGDTPQGGLGGVGIENWILQNGGSFIDAAKSFVNASKGKSFEEFIGNYRIWDFGDNHLALRKEKYPHDDFVYNMSAVGYQKMKRFLSIYVDYLSQENTSSISIDECLEEYHSLGEDDFSKFYIRRKFGYKEDEVEEILADVSILLKADGIVGDVREASMGQTGFMYEVDIDGVTHLVKPGVNKNLDNRGKYRTRPARVEMQGCASRVQKALSPATAVDVKTIGTGDVRIAVQEKIETIPCIDVVEYHPSELLGEYVVDYLIGNFDADESNFVVDKDNHLRGIDKEQGLKYLLDSTDTLGLEMDASLPNTRGCVYPRLFKRIREGLEVDFSYLYRAIEQLKSLDVSEIFASYATSYDASKKDEILSRIKERKEYFLEHIDLFIKELTSSRQM